MSSTDHSNHRAAKRRGDKFDRPMTRGKLLGNTAPLFIFISILVMTQLISFLWKSDNKKFTRLTAVKTERLGLLPARLYRDIMSCRWLNRGKESSHIRIKYQVTVCLSISLFLYPLSVHLLHSACTCAITYIPGNWNIVECDVESGWIPPRPAHLSLPPIYIKYFKAGWLTLYQSSTASYNNLIAIWLINTMSNVYFQLLRGPQTKSLDFERQHHCSSKSCQQTIR